jgi:hypothetical protein
MSQDPSPDIPLTEKPEEENLPIGRILGIAGGALLLFVICIVWSQRILAHQTDVALPGGAPPLPRSIGKEEIGIVDQSLFELEGRAEALKKQKRQHLGSYGWVDREKGIIHIPIDQAMEQVVAEQKR